MAARLIIAAAVLLRVSAALAAGNGLYQPCPTFQAGWSMSYAPPITAVQYDQFSGLLYVIFNNTVASAYSGVPISVMQAFSQTQNPVPLYNSLVVPSYHALLLQQQNNCPLLFENGAFIWTR